jgi:shikimate kinase
VNVRLDVEEEDRTRTHGKGAWARRPDPGANIVLVGLRASGKTTLGRRVARRLERPFLDTDEMVADRTGATIEELVAHQGWEAFREVEHAVLAEALDHRGRVVATGGGVVLRPDNRALLKERGRVFYLMADVPLLASRLGSDPGRAQRPSLTGQDVVEELRETLVAREPLYMEVMDFVLQAGRPLDDLVQSVMEKYAL